MDVMKQVYELVKSKEDRDAINSLVRASFSKTNSANPSIQHSPTPN
jgi:hypothetical protein